MSVTVTEMEQAPRLLEQVVARLERVGRVAASPMFGGTGLQLDDVLVAVVRDERLYVRRAPDAGEQGLRPFPDRQLHLGFYPVPQPERADSWLPHCVAAVAEVQDLAGRVPGPPRFAARRLD